MKKIRVIDGFRLRQYYPDLDIVEEYEPRLQRRGSAPHPYVPKDEIWIDRHYLKELPFLRRVLRAERRLASLGGDKARAWLKQNLTKKGLVPALILRSEKRGTLTLRHVRGDIIRRHVDPWFIFGGHDLVYDYIPKNEVWLDACQDPREIENTLFHELHERQSMASGMAYEEAHDLATQAERKRYAQQRAAGSAKPLALKPFRQRPGYCGPASLKIVCSFFGREYEELLLGKLCSTSAKNGTNHAGLVKAAKTLGANVLAKSAASLEEVRRLVRRERLPVIVGWYSPADGPSRWKFVPGVHPVEDHFSVIYHVTDEHVFMVDPEIDGDGRRKMSVSRFKQLWWDTDGPKGARVDRWMMAIRFDGETFPGT